MSFKAFALISAIFISVESSCSIAQIVVSRSQFGFNDSRTYFMGFTGNGLNDSIEVGIPSADSAQTFDFRSIYYSYSCVSRWSNDTTTIEAKQKFVNADDIQLEVKPWDSQQQADSVFSFFSSHSGITSDTLFYHGEEDRTFLSDSIVLKNPLPFFIFPLRLNSQWSDTSSAYVAGAMQKVI